MPSASKNIGCSNTSYKYTISVSWSESSPSVTNNTSKITASGSMSASNVAFSANTVYNYYLRLYWHDNRTNKDTLFASSGVFHSCGMGYGSRSVSGSITVTHKDDGSLSGYVKMKFESPSTSGGWAPVTSWVQTANTALTTIARASSFSFSSYSNLGSAVNITIDRKSTSFTHIVQYSFAGSAAATVTSNAATSSTFTPPISLATQIPNSTTGSLTVYVTTMNGSTQIGSTVTKSVNLGVPSSVVPTMGAPTVTRIDNSVPSDWGIYVKGFSQVKIAMTSVAGSYGSTITSYSIVGPNLVGNESTYTSTVIQESGTLTYTCKITDSRGRIATKTVQIQVVDYSIPSMTVSAVRCDSSGTVIADGTYLLVTANYSIANVSGKNSVASKSVICNGVSNTEFGDANPFVLAANVSIGSAYVLTAKVTDALGKSAEASVTIPTSERIMNVRANKKGLAIGKFSEKDAFEVAWPTYFENNVHIDGDLGITGTLVSKGRSVFTKETYVHAAAGTPGTSGYIKFAQIEITATYVDSPISIGIVQRHKRSPVKLYITFNGGNTTDPSLSNSYFVFDGDDDYNIYISAIAGTSKWDLYIEKSDAWDGVTFIDYTANIADMGGKHTLTWLDEQVNTLPETGYQIATNINNLTRYNASAAIDPNTTIYPLILTNHANKPAASKYPDHYWYIQTFFYAEKHSTSIKAQIALPYGDYLSMYHRNVIPSSGAWTPWTRLVNANETGVTRYNASAAIDPNTTIYPLILTNHANKPAASKYPDHYWYIQTFFYAEKHSTSIKAQIALPYGDYLSMYHRNVIPSSGAWTPWTRLVNANETGVLMVRGTTTTTAQDFVIHTAATVRSMFRSAYPWVPSGFGITNGMVLAVYNNGHREASYAHFYAAHQKANGDFVCCTSGTGNKRVNYCYFLNYYPAHNPSY